MFNPIWLSEGLRMYSRARKVKKHGWKRYNGTAEEICHQIISDCWNGTYFQVSSGHFCQFYSRDFSWICKSLIELGYVKEVKSTLQYALSKFKQHGHITVAISPKGKCFDFPAYAVDSVASVLYALEILNDKQLINEFRDFLEKEIEYVCKRAVDKSGLVRKDKYFSSMKDYSKRKSSCYDNCMLYLIQQSCNKLKLKNPVEAYDYPSFIMRHFWTGEYFLDDLSGSKYVAGDANVFPFWTGVIVDKEVRNKAIRSLVKSGLDKPFPLCYTSKQTKVKLRLLEIFSQNYERDVAWTHMGPLFIQICPDKLQKEYLKQYSNTIETCQNYLEVFNQKRHPLSDLILLCR